MRRPDSYGPPAPEDRPVWILTDKDIRLEKKPEAAQPKAAESSYLLGSPLLSFSLLLTLLAYFLDIGEWREPAERFISGKSKAVSAEPYRRWAAAHPLSYDEVAAGPDAWTGKAVDWEISRSPAGNYFFDQDGAKRVRWSGEVASLESAMDLGGRARVLARIEGAETGAVLLMFLQSL